MTADKRGAFHLLDWLIISYALAVCLFVVAFSGRIDAWQMLAGGHFAIAVFAAAIATRATRHPHSIAVRLLRIYFPAFAFAYTYLSLDQFQSALYGDYIFTDALIAADLAIFGTHPTVAVQAAYGSVLDEVLSFFYLSYFVVGLIVTVRWLLQSRHRAVLAACAAVAATYVANFALFVLLPARGPRNTSGLAELHQGDYEGLVFGPLSFALEGSGGSIAGGVFPSLHVSAAIAWALVTWRFDRAIAPLITTCAVGIFFATVYLGYHHGIDPLFGAALAFIAVPIAWRCLERRGELK